MVMNWFITTKNVSALSCKMQSLPFHQRDAVFPQI